MKKLYTHFFFFILFILCSTRAIAIDISKTFSEIFIENKGQVKDEGGRSSENVLFYSQGKEMQLFITSTGYSIVTAESDDKKTTYHKIDFKLEHASIQKDQIIYVKGNVPSFNFYHGSNSLEDVRCAHMVIIRNIYPGIDWVWSFDNNKNVQHEFMVNIGADAKLIQYSVAGADAKVSETNNIIYSNEHLRIKEGPVMLQYNKKDVAANLLISGNRVSFQIPSALSGGGFTIDPPLQLLWGAVLDSLRTSFKSIVPDDSLNTITVGYSSDYAVPTFPQVNGSYSIYPSKAKDVIIMKTEPNQNLIWATFFGGSNNDEANAVTATPTGIFVTGYSESWDFPQAVYGNYNQPVQLFGRDAFVAKFNNLGKWKWGTGYGGSQADEGMDIKYYNGKIYLGGYTKSGDFPVLTKAGAYNYQDTSLTKSDAFVLQFDTAGNRNWATCFGGSGNDYITSVFADASGFYTTGYSDSIDTVSIPLQNPGGGAYYQTTHKNAESFITKFSAAGALNWSSYIGGNGNDYSTCIIRNSCGVFICGKTDSTGLPVLSQNNGNYFQPNYAGGTDGFLAKFDASTLQQLYTTYYGTHGEDALTKMSTDVNCNTIATGYTNGPIQIVGSPYLYFIQDSLKGGYDGLMLGLDNNQVPFWSTYFGSEGNDFGYSIWFPNKYIIDMVGEGFYNYGKYRIGGTYVNPLCTDIQHCPQVTCNGVSNRFLNVEVITGFPGGGSGGGGGGGCSNFLQFHALIPTKNTCPNQCNGEARMDTANIGGCPPFQLIWNNGDLGLVDTSLCELYWSMVRDAGGQQRVIYGRFDILRVLYSQAAVSYCAGAYPNWDSLIHITGGGPPYHILFRGDTGSCPARAFFDISDTAGCILSYSMPWTKENIGLVAFFEIGKNCELILHDTIPYGSCKNIPDSSRVVLYDGVDTFYLHYKSVSQFITQPGRYYSGYLDIDGCHIPIDGVYRLHTIQDSISKVLACHSPNGSITVTVLGDTAAFQTPSGNSYTVYVELSGDSTHSNYQYSFTFSNSSSQTYTFGSLLADSYHIKLFSVGCDTVRATVDLKTLHFSFNSPNTYCGVTDTLVADISGGFLPYNYQWSPTEPNTSSIIINTSGIYSLTATDNIGCSATATVTVPGSLPLIITSLTENTAPCSPGLFSSAQVTATGGSQPYSYLWSSGESVSGANFLPQGTNSVRVYDVHGCIATDTFQNTKMPLLTISETISTPTCFSYDDGSIDLSVTNGYPAYTYNWVAGNSAHAGLLTAGNYDYTVTDTKGCEVTGSVTLTQPDSIDYFKFTFSATCAAKDGYADINVNGGSGNISILWEDFNSTYTRYDLDSGIHTFTLTDQNGCSQQGAVNIGEYTPPLNNNITTTDVTCFGNSDGTAIVTVNDVYTPINFNWDNGESGSTITDFYYGNYTVTITDSIGCKYEESIFINQPDELYIYDIQTGDASCSAADGYAYVSISGGTQPYSVNWNDGGTGVSRNNLSASGYSFTVTDLNNCQTFGSVTISQNNPMDVNLGTNDVSCFGNSDGSANVSVTNALTPVTYNWSAGSQLTYQNNLPAGGYFVTVTDNRGCISIVPFQIYEPDVLVGLADTGTGIACYGQSVQVIIYATGGTYPYNNTGNFNYSSGTYTNTISDSHGCSASVTFSLAQPDSLSGNVVIDQPTCTNGGGSVTITASGATGPYDIWYSAVDYGTISSSISLTPVTGFHTVQIIDSRGCETDLGALVNDIVAPSGNVTYTVDPLCNGGSNGAAHIEMSHGANPFTVQGLSFTDSVTIHNLSAGSYTYTVTDANNCTTTVDFTLYDPAPITAGYNVVQDFICSDDSAIVTIYASGGTGAFTGTGTFNFGGGNFAQPVTDANGCVSTVSFTLTPPPPFTVDTTIVPPTCTDNFGYVHFYTYGGAAPYTIQTGTNTAMFIDSTTVTLLPGAYSYTISDNLGCSKIFSFTLNSVNAVSGYITTQNAVCHGDSTGSLKIIITNGTTPYLVNGVAFSDSITVNNLTAGYYQYTITDANGCGVSLGAGVSEPTALIVDSSIVLSNVSCSGRNDATLEVFAHGGTITYTYTLVNALHDTISQSGNVFAPLASGNYEVIVTDSFGCITVSNVAVDTFHHAHHKMEVDSVTCYGKNNGAIKIYSEPSDRNPFTYSLNGETSQVYNVFYNLTAGNYQIIINDKNNCADTLYASITQHDSIDGRVWLNGELLPLDSINIDERQFAEFTKQNYNPWSVELSPDVEKIINSDTLVKTQPREDISYIVTVYQDSLDRNCFVQYKGLIELRNVPALPNILTPNGDGFNDTWKIDLDKFPNADVTIFDRWGEIIFESKHYANDWDGLYHGKHIADGTYFYILKVSAQGNQVYKGNINVLNSSN